MKHIVLVEPNLCGHHEMYLKYFTKVMLSLNCKTTIISIDIEAVDLLFPAEQCNDLINFSKIKYKRNLLLKGKGIKKKFIVVVNSIISVYNLYILKKKIPKDCSLVFFCTVDDYMNDFIPIYLFDFIMHYKWGGLYLQANRNNKVKCFDKRKLFLSKRCIAVAILGKASPFLSNLINNKIVIFPDFTETSLPEKEYFLAQEIRKKANGRKIVSLLGAIASRKGLKTFINTTTILDESDFFYVLAGEGAETSITKEEIQLINSQFKNKSNCFYHPEKIISDEDFNSLIDCSDIIYAAYIDFEYSSNMLTKASFFRKPIIVSKGYYMEEVVNKHRIGLAIEQNNSTQCRDAILSLSSRDFIHNIKPEFDLFYKDNSIDVLYSRFSHIHDRC